MPSAACSSYEREDFIELRIVHVYQPRQDHTYMMLSGEVSAIDILPRLKPWAFPPDHCKNQSNSGAAITDIFELIN